MIRRLIKRVVVTGLGSGTARSVVTAFKRRGWLVVGVDAQFHAHEVNQFHIVSRADQPGFVDELLLLVRRERTTLVIPTRDAECLAVSRRSGAFRGIGAVVYVPDPSTVEDLVGSGGMRLVKGLGIPLCDSLTCSEPLAPGSRWFEVSICRDGRNSLPSMACAVHELTPETRGHGVTVERRKDQEEVEAIALRVAQRVNLNGTMALLLRESHDGRLAVARAVPRPCEYAPLVDDIADAFIALWERDQPT